MNTRFRTFLNVVSVFFAALLALQIGRVLVHSGERRDAALDRHLVFDRPADPTPAASTPRTPGRSLIRQVAHAPSAAPTD